MQLCQCRGPHTPHHTLTRWLAAAQMPFANLTVGQVFFAVVHEKTRPPLDVLDKARQDLPEDEQVMLNKYEALMTSCWAEAPANRPTFLRLSLSSVPSGEIL